MATWYVKGGCIYDSVSCKVYLYDHLAGFAEADYPAKTDADMSQYDPYLRLGGSVGGAKQIELGLFNHWCLRITDTNGLQQYNPNTATWETIGGGGIANVVEDLTPQLGGDLDLNNKNITFKTTNTTSIGTSTSSAKEVSSRIVESDDDLTLTPASGKAVKTAKQIVSSLAIGTKPLDVTSTTVCTNLNSDKLDGADLETTWTDSDTKLVSSKGMKTKVDALITTHTGVADAHHAAVTVSAPISLTTQAIKLVNDAAATVTEIDTDTTLAGGDTKVPTDAATKTYADTKISKTTAGEIAAMTEKTTTIAADLVVIEDSASSNAKKKVQLGNLAIDISKDLSPQLGAALDLNTKTIDIEDQPADNGYEGYTITCTITGSPTIGDIMYPTSTAGTWAIAKADSINTMPVAGIYVAANTILIFGVVRNDAGFGGAFTMTNGFRRVYASSATAGASSTTAPSTVGHYVQRIGIALGTRTLLFNPGGYEEIKYK